jgi:uncharacterized protein involved in oxidation of intracellular sulfur
MSAIEQGTQKTILLILNEAPYGSERTYNGLRLAGTLSRRQEVELKLFLIGDAVSCARSGQKVPPGYYSTETMLAAAIRHGAAVGVCGSCIDARGITDGDLTGGSRRSTLDELTSWTLEADKVIVF